MAKSSKGTLAEEYIISIIPELDEKKFEDARKKVEQIVKPAKKQEKEKTDEKAEKEKVKTEISRNSRLKQTANIIKGASGGAEQFANAIGKITASTSVIVAAIMATLKIFDELSSTAKDFSNSMITANSAFVNKDTRQLMATFGVSGQTATGMSSVMNLMGINTSDFAMMTPAQMQLYSTLMQQWQDGMNSIDSGSLAKFQEVMQSFQSEFASAKLELQIQFYKMLVDIAPALEDFFNGIIELIKSLGALLNSPIVKSIINTLGTLITNIVRIVTALSYALSLDFASAGKALAGVSTGSTTNNYTITSTSNNSYSGDTSSMYALATATQETETNSILTTLNSTGGT